MTSADATKRCENCGRSFPAPDVGRRGLCPDCRSEVVRRATIIARVIGGLGGVLVGMWVVTVVEPGRRFVLVWLILIGLVYFLLFKLARRVAFEAFRSRGVPPPDQTP